MAARRQECSICKDSFKNPKLISCHHTFCSKCLEGHVRARLHNGKFPCPICRRIIDLPTGGVSAFQTNFYIETDPVRDITCDLCGPKGVACRKCLDCDENMCQSCCTAHEKSKASRNHRISDLGTLGPVIKGKIRQGRMCDLHTDEEIKLVCRDCSELICVQCKAFDHKNHATKTVANAADEARKALQTTKNECVNTLKHIDVCKQKVEMQCKEINDAEQKEIKAIEDHRLMLIKVLDEEVAKMKEKVQSVYKDQRQNNSKIQRDIQVEYQTCLKANENAQKLIDEGTDFEIIEKSPNLAKLMSATASKLDQLPNSRLEKDLYSPGDIKRRNLISLLGMMRDSTEINHEQRGEKLNILTDKEIKMANDRFDHANNLKTIEETLRVVERCIRWKWTIDSIKIK